MGEKFTGICKWAVGEVCQLKSVEGEEYGPGGLHERRQYGFRHCLLRPFEPSG